MSKRDHLENLGADGKIILKNIFKKWEGPCTGFVWLRSETGSEPSGSIKQGEFID
jgi:hypothetical protein